MSEGVVSQGQYKFDDPAEAYKLARRRITNNALRRQQKSLDLSRFGLVDVPPEIGALSELTHLDLSNNRLGRLPPEIGNLRKLRSISLGRNTLSVFPEEFWTLPSLRFLYASSNQFVELPAAVQQLSALRHLHMDNNMLSSLPDEIGQLAQLRQLEIQENHLSSFPTSIGQLAALTDLRADDNEISVLPNEIQGLTKLDTLWLSGNRLTDLPTVLGRLSGLSSLDLSNNKLASLPATLGNLIWLTDLDVSNNQITKLPSEIGHCVELEGLHLANNSIESLPSEIRFLKKLVLLDARSNRLPKLPSEIGALESLRRLYLDGNLLDALPQEIGRLHGLQRLTVRNNKLTSVPGTVGGFRDLRLLELQNNILERLPSELGRVRSLGSAATGQNNGRTKVVLGLHLDRNPLPDPFPRLIAPGQPSATTNVLAWLRSEFDTSSLPTNSAPSKEKPTPPVEPTIERGPNFQVTNGRYDLVADIEVDHFDNAAQEALLRRIRRQVGLLQQENLKVGNQHPLLVRTMDEYALLLSRPLAEIDVLDVWSVGTSVLAQALAFERQDAHRTISEPLEPIHLALLIEVSRLHGGFILGFPKGIELTERSDAARISPETARLIETPTSEILSSFAKQRRLLSDRARGLADALEAGLLTASWNAARVGHVSYAMLRNFLIATGKTILLANEQSSTLVGGLMLTAALQQSGLTPEAAVQLFEFIRSNAASILSFVAPFPELRAWVEWMINYFDEQDGDKAGGDGGIEIS